jgi:acyl carrier protein
MGVDTLSRVAKAVTSVIQRELGVTPAAIGELTFDQLGLDSIAILSVLVAVEDEFNVELGDDTPAEALRSLGKLATYLDHAHHLAA